MNKFTLHWTDGINNFKLSIITNYHAGIANLPAFFSIERSAFQEYFGFLSFCSCGNILLIDIYCDYLGFAAKGFIALKL
ncbi:hypothetical protein ES703_91264 [subsurface metagenome]